MTPGALASDTDGWQYGKQRRRVRRAKRQIRRLEYARNPRGAPCAEAASEDTPRVRSGDRVGSGGPVLLPVLRAPRAFVRREVELVRVDVNLVGIDAHA